MSTPTEQIRDGLADAGDLLIPMADIGEAVVAIAELRGYALAEPNREASRYIFDRLDRIARLLGLEDTLKRVTGDLLEGRATDA